MTTPKRIRTDKKIYNGYVVTFDDYHGEQFLIGDFSVEILWDNEEGKHLLSAKRVQEQTTEIAAADNEFYSPTEFYILEQGGVYQKPLPSEYERKEKLQFQMVEAMLDFMQLRAPPKKLKLRKIKK